MEPRTGELNMSGLEGGGVFISSHVYIQVNLDLFFVWLQQVTSSFTLIHFEGSCANTVVYLWLPMQKETPHLQNDATLKMSSDPGKLFSR